MSDEEIYLLEANPTLLSLIVSEVAGRKDIPIRIDDRAQTAFTNYREIVLSVKAIPKNVKNVYKIQRCYDALAAHEAGHWTKTLTNERDYRAWLKTLSLQQQGLARDITNHIEDPRVDNWISWAWKRSFGASVRFYNKMMCPLVEDKVREVPEGDRLTKAMAMLIALGCYDSKRPLEWFTKDKKVIEAVDKSVRIIKKLVYGRFPKEFVDGANIILLEMEQFMQKGEQVNKQFIPVKQGGEMQGEASETDPEEDGKGDKEDISTHRGKKPKLRVKTGKSAGMEIPAPTPNLNRYLRLSQKNADRVRRLLELLKKKTWMSRVKHMRFQKRGRLMFELLPMIDASAQMGRPQEDIYETRHLITKEAESVYFGVVVDVSGSMDFYDSLDALTTLSDVAGKWLKDEEFALLIFGAGFQKIKAFVERYDIARARIGGINGTLSHGTRMLGALKAMHKMFNNIENRKKKVLVLVSDFATEEPAESMAEVKLMAEDEITVIAVGMGGTNLETAKQWSKFATYITDISQLPELFAEIWDASTETINNVLVR